MGLGLASAVGGKGLISHPGKGIGEASDDEMYAYFSLVVDAPPK